MSSQDIKEDSCMGGNLLNRYYCFSYSISIHSFTSFLYTVCMNILFTLRTMQYVSVGEGNE